MNILFDIGHPAHVHLFKNFISYLVAQEHNVTVVTRKKDITENLLSHYNIPFISLSKPKKTLIGMFFELIERDIKIINLHRKKNFEIAIGSSVSIGHLTLLKGISSFNFNEDDDEMISLVVKISHPFNTKIINPNILISKKFKNKKIFHSSYHELAYLHPGNFTPDEAVLDKYSLKKNEYVIIRKSALTAYHDQGAKGLSGNVWDKMVELCSRYQIVSSIEGKYTHSIDPWDMHHVLYYAILLITDGLSMSIEAAVLGTFSIRFNSFEGKSSVLRDIDKYGISVGINSKCEGAETTFIETIKKILKKSDLSEKANFARRKILTDKIDLNTWMKNWFQKEIQKRN